MCIHVYTCIYMYIHAKICWNIPGPREGGGSRGGEECENPHSSVGGGAGGRPPRTVSSTNLLKRHAHNRGSIWSCRALVKPIWREMLFSSYRGMGPGARSFKGSEAVPNFGDPGPAQPSPEPKKNKWICHEWIASDAEMVILVWKYELIAIRLGSFFDF